MVTKEKVKEIPLKRPKGVGEDQWAKAKELYKIAKLKGDAFPELTVAQAALETTWFKKPSGKYNYFGQKASKSQKGSIKTTQEQVNDSAYYSQEKFRDYNNLEEAVSDRISKWGEKYKDASTAREALSKIWKYDENKGQGVGYATDTKYGEKIDTILNMIGVPSEQEKSLFVYTQEEQSMGPENPPENTDEKNLTNFAETQESSIFAKPSSSEEEDDEVDEVPAWKLALEKKQQERDVITDYISRGGLDFNAPEYERTVLPQPAQQQFEEGGQIPTNPNGVFAVGKNPVRVPTKDGNITMKGVEYPILGIANTGEEILMQPGGEYHFKGATEVLELPQLQKGGLKKADSKEKPNTQNTGRNTKNPSTLDLYDYNNFLNEKTVLRDNPVKEKNKKPVENIENYKGITVNSLDSFMFNNPVDLVAGDSKKYENVEKEFSEIGGNTEGCLAGAMTCSQEFIQENSGLPGLRTILANAKADPKKYRIESSGQFDSDFVENTSIDAWEVHDYFIGEGLGESLFEREGDTTYSDDSILPDGFDYKNIPLGSIIGQGNSAGVYTREEDGEKSRHALVVSGFDEKDGMPMVYDSGYLRRLDDTRVLGKSHKINRITTPNEYKGLTMKKMKSLMDKEKKSLNITDSKPVKYKEKGEHFRSIETGVNAVKDKIAFNYKIPGETIKKIAEYLPGIANQETKINNNEGNSKSILIDNYIGNTFVKPGVKNAITLWNKITNTTKDEGDYKQDFELEIEAFKKFGKDKKKRDAYITKGQESREDIKQGGSFDNNTNSSVGPFANKDVTEYSKKKLGLDKSDLYGILNSNDEELENGSKVALSYLAENYNKYKEKYKDLKLTDEQLIEIAVVSYNNKGKAESKDFIKYYIQDRVLTDDYLDKVKGLSKGNDNRKTLPLKRASKLKSTGIKKG